DDIKEDTELVTAVPEGIEDEDEQLEYDYGVMKTLSEKAATTAFGPDRTIIVRPTYMVGPADKTNRFIHWPIRLSRGGETLVPGKEDDPVQYLDVRDVAEFMIRLAEAGKTGAYNAVGPSGMETIREFVTRASAAFPVKTTPVYIDDYSFLREHSVYYLVPWIPTDGQNYGSSRISNTHAIAAGLTFRPLIDTMQETLIWWRSDAVSQEQRDKVEGDEKHLLQREGEVLTAWVEQVGVTD
ncbi:MAG: NAD-dependent epimerase/dehydratase family protein, partial [Bacteroidota bacterium]